MSADIKIYISRPDGMEAMRKLTEQLAASLERIKRELDAVTQQTPEEAGKAAALYLHNGSAPRRTVEGIAGSTNSVISGALTSLQHAAEDVGQIYTEMVRVGVPKGATW